MADYIAVNPLRSEIKKCKRLVQGQKGQKRRTSELSLPPKDCSHDQHDRAWYSAP